MGKIVDITDKLSFDENPNLVIKGEKYEVKADARTMLEIMGLFGSKTDTEAAMLAYEKMLSEKDRKKIDKLNLPFKDLMVIIQEAMSLIKGGGDDEGEDVTRTTT